MTETIRPDYLLPGTNIKGYIIDRLIGAGSSGAVYEVHCEDDSRFALKVSRFRPGKPSSHDWLMDRRFARSISCLVALRGVKNVAQLYAHDRYPNLLSGWQFFVQELVPGSETLLDWARRTSPTLRELAGVFRQLALACGEMAHAEIRHRDLKPSNILMGEGGVPKVIDFDSAIIFRAEDLTGPRPSEVPGTPAYFSPEHCAAILKERAGHPAKPFFSLPTEDMHALGVIFYQVFTGKHPFAVAGQTEDELLKQIARARPPRPRDLNPGIPFVLDEAVMHLLAKDPALRCQNGDDLVKILEQGEKNTANASWDVPFQPGESPAMVAPVAVQVPAPTPSAREDDQPALTPSVRKDGSSPAQVDRPQRPAAWFAVGAVALVVAAALVVSSQHGVHLLAPEDGLEVPPFDPELVVRADHDSDVAGVPSTAHPSPEAVAGAMDASMPISALVLRATLITGPLPGQKLAPCDKEKAELKYKGACWRLLYYRGNCDRADLYEPEEGYCKKVKHVYEPVYVETKAKKPGTVVEPDTSDVPVFRDAQP